MFHAYSRILELVPALNVRPLTEDDFWELVWRYDIRVQDIVDFEVDGDYFPVTIRRKDGSIRTKHCIRLNDEMRGMLRLETIFHEFFHFVLHWPYEFEDVETRPDFDPTQDPAPARKQLHPRVKQEYEARAFAAMALIPAWMLRCPDFDYIMDHGFALATIRLRIEVMERYGI